MLLIGDIWILLDVLEFIDSARAVDKSQAHAHGIILGRHQTVVPAAVVQDQTFSGRRTIGLVVAPAGVCEIGVRIKERRPRPRVRSAVVLARRPEWFVAVTGIGQM